MLAVADGGRAVLARYLFEELMISVAGLVAAEVRRAFRLATTALLRPLRAARAEQRLEAGIRSKLHGKSMSREFNPPLLRIVAARID
jgi:hypothetical protein